MANVDEYPILHEYLKGSPYSNRNMRDKICFNVEKQILNYENSGKRRSDNLVELLTSNLIEYHRKNIFQTRGKN